MKAGQNKHCSASLPAWKGVQKCFIAGNIMETKTVKAGTALLVVLLIGISQGLCWRHSGALAVALWGTLISGQLAGLGGIACLALSQGGNVMSLRVRQLEEMEKRLWNLLTRPQTPFRIFSSYE